MKFVRAYRYICLVSLAAFAATEAQASRLYFSTVGPGGSPIANSTSLPTVPTVNLDLTSNPTGTLHIWMQVDVQPPAAGITINGLSYDIATSNPAVATPTAHAMVNPATVNADGDPATRWVDTGPGFPTTDANLWVQRSAASALGNTTAIGNRDANFTRDPMDDIVSRSYYIGSVNFNAAAAGTTGLYFRAGGAITTTVTPPGPADLQFGSSTTTYRGDQVGQGNPILPNDPQADALIVVMGGVEPPDVMATITPHALGDLTPGVALLDGSPKGTFVDVTPNVTAGRININNFVGEANGELTVFFDLVNDAQAAQLVTDLNAIVGRAFTASLSNFVGNNPSGRNDGDIALSFAGAGGVGSSQFIDFDFGAAQVQAVGIPEPSTYALASLALMATAVYARRRRAA